MKLSILSLAAVAVSVFALPAIAHPVDSIGTLSNVGEASPAGGPSLGTGSVTVTLDEDTFAMRVQVTYSGLTGTTTAAHIHCCTSVAGSGTAGVASVTPSFTDFTLGGATTIRLTCRPPLACGTRRISPPTVAPQVLRSMRCWPVWPVPRPSEHPHLGSGQWRNPRIFGAGA